MNSGLLPGSFWGGLESGQPEGEPNHALACGAPCQLRNELLESGALDVHELVRPGRTVPLDVDTWDDYVALGRATATEPVR